MKKEFYKLTLVFIMIIISFSIAFFLGREITLSNQRFSNFELKNNNLITNPIKKPHYSNQGKKNASYNIKIKNIDKNHHLYSNTLRNKDLNTLNNHPDNKNGDNNNTININNENTGNDKFTKNNISNILQTAATKNHLQNNNLNNKLHNNDKKNRKETQSKKKNTQPTQRTLVNKYKKILLQKKINKNQILNKNTILYGLIIASYTSKQRASKKSVQLKVQHPNWNIFFKKSKGLYTVYIGPFMKKTFAKQFLKKLHKKKEFSKVRLKKI